MKPIRNIEDVNDGLKQLLKLDPNLLAIAKQVGDLPLRLQEPGFAGLARIVIGQQVSTASAAAIHARFVKHISPLTPSAFLEAGEPAWIEIGLSRAKQSTLEGLAKVLTSGELDLALVTQLPAEDAIAQLTALKGIGPWTAEVYLLFSAGHPDIFPAGDLALQEAIKMAFNLDTRPDEKEVRNKAVKWSPYRGIAARLFWAYYRDVKTGREGVPL
ncbi:MAG: DNA-3-methyladenine glycosylase [Rhizobiaceae bacterium]|nr:DNA-3-methyladenine glycosylase [Rhizobiaceae bacterium]